MRERLENAAATSGRSISEEIEYRLNQSFEEDRLSAAFLGGPDTAKALQLIGIVMRRVTADGDGTPWSKDQKKVEAVQTAAQFLIAGSAGLPVVSPTFVVTDLGDSGERGRKLAKSILEIENLSLPEEKR
jgi:hypothetical protein